MLTRKCSSTGRGGLLNKGQLVLIDAHLDGIILVQIALENFLGQRVLEESLDGAAHRPGAVIWIVPLLNEEILGPLVELELKILVFEPFRHFAYLQIEDLNQ